MTTNDPDNQPNRHHIHWNDFDDAVQDVTDAIRKQRTRNQLTNDMLIGIQMGGLPLMSAVVNRLKDKYGYKIDNLQIATTSAYRPCIKALAQQFNDHIDTGNIKSRIWLFEDIVDTGATIKNLISRLIIKGNANISSKMITTCCVVSRVPSTTGNDLNIIAGQRLPFDPQTFITFPWEVQ